MTDRSPEGARMPDLKINAKGGPVTTKVIIQKQHVGVTSVDLWNDSDDNGRPDAFIKRIKQPNENENQPVALGNASDLGNKVVQWIWMPSQPPGQKDGWQVLIDLQQDGKSVAGMPVTLNGDYPDAQAYGLFETWYRLVNS
jgi:hypothetical protein